MVWNVECSGATSIAPESGDIMRYYFFPVAWGVVLAGASGAFGAPDQNNIAACVFHANRTLIPRVGEQAFHGYPNGHSTRKRT
ncbi:hypothetical protein, partial [Burkholderia diffusa]|uniref:hypothetical protein n=1 Tax=Burkholderia diffusa TaxID=488732 RepID=UPI001ABB28B8